MGGAAGGAGGVDIRQRIMAAVVNPGGYRATSSTPPRAFALPPVARYCRRGGVSWVSLSAFQARAPLRAGLAGPAPASTSLPRAGIAASPNPQARPLLPPPQTFLAPSPP